MEAWTALVAVAVILLFKAIHGIFIPASRLTLPPGPFAVPLIGNIELMTTSFFDLPSFVCSLKAKFGPLVTLCLGSRKFIFVSDASLAYEALIQNGTVFADRPPPSITQKISSYNQHNILSSHYGAKWRLFRRNLTSGILHRSRQIPNSMARHKVLQLLIQQLRQSTGPKQVVELFRNAIGFSHSLICLGEDVDYEQVMELQTRLKLLVDNAHRFPLLDAFPNLSKIVLRRQWEEFRKLVSDNEDAMLPFILKRKTVMERNSIDSEGGLVYLDTLLSLSEDEEKLTDLELIGFCGEFLTAAVDSITTTLQWTFANLVKQPMIQQKLYTEIEEIMGKESGDRAQKEEVIEIEQLRRMKYLKAVVLETLRRHPPTHVLLPHSVSEDAILGGRLVPKSSCIIFVVRDIGLDPTIWEEPMEFKPERFVDREAFDIRGTKGIQMLPFGAGRRMCPGYAYALQELEFLVANLVWRFQWKEVDGVGVDLSEKRELLVGMKNPLQVHCLPRRQSVD